MEYNGERFLDVLYTQLYKSEEVLHTKEKKDTKEESIKRYMDRLESIHNKANTQSKKDLVKRLYFNKYVIKKENLPYYLDENTKQGIIESQEKSLSTWIDYLTDENAVYPMWAKYWVFQQMLKMGIYDEVSGKYTKRTKNTINPFIEANPEVIAKCIGDLTKLLGNEKLSTQQIRKLISNISFEKMYIEYQNNIKEQYKSNEGIWIKYNQGNEENAKKLAASLEGHNTGWCTASESTAIAQLCGLNGYGGGDFYVYYTKDEEENYKIPRIAIRLNGHDNIAEIRGVEEHQNLEEEMIPILETKLHEMNFLEKNDVDKNIGVVNGLKYLVEIKNKTLNNISLTEQEVIDLYTKEYGFGWEQDPLVEKTINKRDIINDYNILKDDFLKVQFIRNNLSQLIAMKAENFVKEKNIMLELIEYDYFEKGVFDFASLELKKDKEFILEILQINGTFLECISKKFREDREIVTLAVSDDGLAIKYASEDLKEDREIVLTAIWSNAYALQYLSDTLKDDKEIVIQAVRNRGMTLDFASNRLKNDKEIVLEAVYKNGFALKYASEELKMDKEVAMTAVMNDPYSLQYVSYDLSNDKEIVLAAVKKSAEAIKYAGTELKNNKEIILSIVEVVSGVFPHLSHKFLSDKDIVLAAVRKNGKLLQNVHGGLRSDKEVVLTAIDNDYNALKYAYKEYYDGVNDRELVLAAVRKNVKALKYAGRNFITKFNEKNILSGATYELTCDKDFIIEIVKYDGTQLRYVDEELKKDKEVVMLAVKNNGYALQYASTELQDDRQVVMEALKNNGNALKFASPRLQNAERVVLVAIRQTKSALQYAGEKLKTKEFALKLLSCGITYQELLENNFIGSLEFGQGKKR